MSNFFKEAPVLKKLSKEEQKLIANNIYRKLLKRHHNTLRLTRLYRSLVEIGAVRAYILSEDGKEITLYRLLPRDICMFSASCVMNNISFDIFMETITNTVVHVITDIFKTLKNTSLPVADYISKLMVAGFLTWFGLLSRWCLKVLIKKTLQLFYWNVGY